MKTQRWGNSQQTRNGKFSLYKRRSVAVILSQQRLFFYKEVVFSLFFHQESSQIMPIADCSTCKIVTTTTRE
jgi:hypothetical protein